jgi:hypothetical protein
MDGSKGLSGSEPRPPPELIVSDTVSAWQSHPDGRCSGRSVDSIVTSVTTGHPRHLLPLSRGISRKLHPASSTPSPTL